MRKRDSVKNLHQSQTLSEMLLHDACMASEEENSLENVRMSPGAQEASQFASMVASESEHLPEMLSKHSRHSGLSLTGSHLLKSSKAERLEALQNLTNNRQKQSKLAKLWLARRREFEELPAEERETLRKAFLDTAKGAETLDSRGLLKALREFGLVVRSTKEKTDVHDLCQE